MANVRIPVTLAPSKDLRVVPVAAARCEPYGSCSRGSVCAVRFRSSALVVLLFLILAHGRGWASGPLIDPLDGQPLGWRLVDADCPAEIRAHWLDANGGLNRRPCEAMTLITGNGTRALMEYRLDPSHVLDEVRAGVAVQALRPGIRVGLRIRYPRIIDPVTRLPAESIVWGDSHPGRSQWARLSVAADPHRRSVLEMGIRSKYGAAAVLDDAYIDAVMLNVYTGAGASTIRVDDLRVDGLIAIESGASAFLSTTASRSAVQSPPPAASEAPAVRISSVESAFPAGQVTRVIEYNGEQLEYLKLLGFDAILLSRPPTADVLREAVQQAMLVYAPPPTAADLALEPFLSCVAGWYLGTSYDESQLHVAAEDERRASELPRLWHRPSLIAPAESWDRYAGIATTIVYDMPLPARGLSGQDESDLLVEHLRRTGRPVVAAVGVATLPPQRLVAQLDGLCRGLGASPVEDYGWHAIWLQVARGMALAPRAVVFRSSRSLESGREADGQRAMALAMVNRWLDVTGPLVGNAQLQGFPQASDPAFHLIHLSSPRCETIIASINGLEMPVAAAVPSSAPLHLRLPTGSNTYAWRITDTAAEQLTITGDANNQSLIIDSPDLVEWIVTSRDPAVGGQLDRALRQHALRLNQERWQLVTDSLMRTREDWRAAVGGGLVPRHAVPSAMLRTAADALAGVQQQIAAGQLSTAMRATRAADAITVRSGAMLRGRLRPASVPLAGMPTLLAPGGTMIHLAWLPSLEDGSWTDNLLASGNLDDPPALVTSGWSHQRRLENVADSAVGIDPTAGESSSGALRIETVARGATPMSGGYAGTVARVRSAPITLPPDSWVRIDVRVKSLGFGGPNQGLLIYDSEAGSEAGVLISGESQWRTVTMYRVITSDRPFRVTFEGLGAGEALVDWVNVAMWRPPGTPTAPVFRPIAHP